MEMLTAGLAGAAYSPWTKEYPCPLFVPFSQPRPRGLAIRLRTAQ
jgi:hypothetical protein